MTPKLRAHVKALLAAKGLSARAASLAVGRNEHFVRDWLSGKVAAPRSDSLQRLARLLGVSLEQLTNPNARSAAAEGERFEFTPEPPLPRPRALKTDALNVRYTVRAGHWLDHDSDEQTPRHGPPVAIDRRVGGEQWLELVEGDSVDQLAPPGSFLHVVGAASIGYLPKHGDLVIVERVRAQGGFRERSVKVVEMRRGGRIELWPASNNPRWREPLKLSPDGESEDAEVEVSVVGRVLGVYFTMPPLNGGRR